MARRRPRKRPPKRGSPRPDGGAADERLRDTLNALSEGVQIIGFDWRYVYVNEAVAHHGRRRPDELLGRTMMEVYPGIERTSLFAELERCMRDRVAHRMENEFVYADGGSASFELRIEPCPEGL